MENFFGILLIIVFLIAVFRPLLGKLFAPLITRWMARKQEDFMRRMMGMPTRKEEERLRKEREKQGRRAARKWGKRPAEPSQQTGAHTGNEAVAFMRTVAEDVEYTEIHITSETSTSK